MPHASWIRLLSDSHCTVQCGSIRDVIYTSTLRDPTQNTSHPLHQGELDVGLLFTTEIIASIVSLLS